MAQTDGTGIHALCIFCVIQREEVGYLKAYLGRLHAARREEKTHLVPVSTDQNKTLTLLHPVITSTLQNKALRFTFSLC